MIVILIEFQDVRHSPGREPEFFSDLLFNSSPGARSLRGYYFENSYGKLEVRGEVTAVWYRSDSNMSFYGADTPSGVDNANGPIHRLVTEAVRKADAEVDFSIFDTDRDGYIDFLTIIHAGQGQESSYQNRDTIWSHRWYDYDEPIVDGVAAGFYTMCSEFSPIGTFAHELGHELGLPDLYDIDGDTLGAGSWDLMSLGSWLDGGATPSHLSAFCKVRLGWIEPMALTASSENLSLQAVELSPSVLKLWVEPPHEYFLIENRQCTGWDAFLPGPGILIWHVDERAADNRDQTLRLVDLEEADEGLNGDSPVQSTDPWRDSEEGFNPGSSPSSSANSGRSTGWWVYKIGPSGNVMGLSVRHVDFDIAVTELRYEVFTTVASVHRIFATVYNLGGRGLRDAPVTLTVMGGNTSLSRTEKIDYLNPGVWRELAWDWTPAETGFYFVTVLAACAGDSIPENDWRSGPLRVIERLFFDDVESGVGGWRVGCSVPALPGLWHIVSAGEPHGDAHSPSHSWWCGFNRTGRYARSAGPIEFFLESPLIDLTGVGSAALAVYMRYDLTHGLPYEIVSDTGRVEVSSNLGASWTTIKEIRGMEQAWGLHVFDLGGFTGGPVKLRFTLRSSALLPGRGWWLDDFTVVASGAIYEVGLGAVPARSSVSSSNTARFNITVANAGSRADTYDLLVDAPAELAVSLGRRSIQLPVFGMGSVPLAVAVTGKLEAGRVLQIRVQASSRASPRVSASIMIEVEVIQEHGLELSCGAAGVRALPGEIARFLVNLSNTGNGEEQVRLRISGKSADIASLSPTAVSLAPWASESIEVLVLVPENSTAGEALRVTLSASSASASASISLEVVVERVYGVTVITGTGRMAARPGDTLRLTLFLRNTGNGADEFVIYSSCPAGWRALHDAVVSLGPRAEAELTVELELSPETPGGRQTVFFTVSGSGGTSDMAAVEVEILLPDLELAGLFVEPRLIDEGDYSSVRLTLRNTGGAAARGISVRLYDNGRVVREWFVDYLGPGESQTLSTTLRPGPGHHQLYAQAMTDDKELSSTNNVAEGELRVRKAGGLLPGLGTLAALAALASATNLIGRARASDRLRGAERTER
ncbi:MAG: M6 family metalloprotease domain-containing protein [Thermoplasmata archaeon]